MVKSPKSKSTPGKRRLSRPSDPNTSPSDSFSSYPSNLLTESAASTSSRAPNSHSRSPSSSNELFTFKCDVGSGSTTLSSPSSACSTFSNLHDDHENPLSSILPVNVFGTTHDQTFSQNSSTSSSSSSTADAYFPTEQGPSEPDDQLEAEMVIESCSTSHCSTPANFAFLSSAALREHPSSTSRYFSLTHCSDFWLGDGNIVLIAEGFAFKVHRGMLERHSEFFEGMFSVPQPCIPPSAMDVDSDGFVDSDLGLYEGCRTVEMHDRADDVYHFLKALYDGLYFVHRPDKPRSSQFPSLVGALRLSAKYFAQDLRERCLERLASDWPTTLRGWDARETEAVDGKGAYIPREYTTHPILLIELAKELGLIEFLPSAFYDLSRYGPSKIFLGTSASKGVLSQSTDTIDIDTSETQSPSQDDPLQPVRLTNDMLARTLRGRERGQKFMHKFVITRILHRAASEDCLYRLEPTNGVASFPCYESFYFIALNVLRAVGGIASGRDADPLFTLLQAVEMLSRMDFENGGGDGGKCGLKMCGACKADFEEDCHKARRAVWRELPRWFGLEDAIDGQWGKD